MSVTIPPDVQEALQKVEDDIASAQDADQANEDAVAALDKAQRDADAAYDADLAAHQQVTEDVQILVDKLTAQMGGGGSKPSPGTSADVAKK